MSCAQNFSRPPESIVQPRVSLIIPSGSLNGPSPSVLLLLQPRFGHGAENRMLPPPLFASDPGRSLSPSPRGTLLPRTFGASALSLQNGASLASRKPFVSA